MNDERGKRIMQDYIRDEMQGPKITSAIPKRNKNEEQSKRLTTYNRLVDEERKNKYGLVERTPILEFNLLLKYLF